MGPYGGHSGRARQIELDKLNPNTLLPLPGFEQPDGPPMSEETRRAIACDFTLGMPCKFIAVRSPGGLWVQGAVYGVCNIAVHFACEEILKPKAVEKTCPIPRP